MSKIMKNLNGYEIVDDYARTQIANLESIASDEEVLEFVMAMGYENPLITDSNIIYTNGNNGIYTL